MTDSVDLTNATDVDAHNQQGIDLLVRNIMLSQGEFSPILAVCNYAELRQQMVERLRQQCPVDIKGVALPKKSPLLLVAIQSRLQQLPPALMVFGLDTLHDLERVLNRANRVREEFRNHLPLPLIIWVSDATLALITRHAPDFYSWMPVAIRFELCTEDVVSLLRQRVDTEFGKFLSPATLIENLPFAADRHQQPYAELAAALHDLEQRHHPLEPDLLAGVQFVQGRGALAQNHLGTARDYFDRSLAFFAGFFDQGDFDQLPSSPDLEAKHSSPTSPLTTPDLFTNALPLHSTLHTPHSLAYQACVYFHLGLTWRLRATVNRAEYDHYCAKARDCFQQCLENFRRLDRPDLVAQYLTPLGEVLHRLRQWDDLEALATEGLTLHQQCVDPIRLANDYGLLAVVAIAREQWREAQRLAIAALDILNKAEQEGVQELDLIWANSYHINWYRFTLAQALYHLGETDGAIATLEFARRETNAHYDAILAINIREHLQAIYYDRADYARAFDLKLEQRSLEQQFGIRAFLGAGQLQPQRQIVNPVQADEESRRAAIAREINASGRRHDVDTLVFRLRESRNKLVIIHGPSGVGKSSILTAALIPELQQTRLDEREILPILLRRYDQWEQGLLEQVSEQVSGDEQVPGVRDQVSGEEQVPGVRFQVSDETSTPHPIPRTPHPIPHTPHPTPHTPHPLSHLQQLASVDYFPILIFDQFEEFFFNPNHSQVEQRLPLYTFLRDCLNTPFIKVVLSLREDYIHYLLEFDRLTALEIIDDDILSKDIRYYLGDFTPDQARDVISSATQGTPYQPEPDLVEQLVADLAGTLQTVRPIELQIVGAELQDSEITTLADYQKLGNQPKEALVTMSLQRVIADCGKEQDQQDLAQLVLYLLTDDKEHRLQKTANELLQDLQTFGITLPPLSPDSEAPLAKGGLGGSSLPLPEQIPPSPPYQGGSPDAPSVETTQSPLDPSTTTPDAGAIEPPDPSTTTPDVGAKHSHPYSSTTAPNHPTNASPLQPHSALRTPHSAPHPLSLILAVLQGSGILLHNLADPAPRYQIVHDYLVSYIRQHYRNRLEAKYAALEAKYEQTLVDKLAVEEQLNQTLADKLRQTRRAVITVTVLWGLFTVAAIAATSFGIRAEQQRQRAQINEIKTLDASAETLYASDRPFDALLTSLKAVRQLQQLPKLTEANRHLIQGTLQETLYNTRERLRFSSDNALVNGIVFSPNGKQVATSGRDGTVRLWDVQGKQLAELKGHQGDVTSVVYSPDGTQVATSGSDGTARLWDLQGKQVAELKGHQGSVSSVVYSPDSKQVATHGEDGTARLWDLQGNQLAELKGDVNSVVYSPDGKQVATSGYDTARLWDLQGNQLAELKGHQRFVWSVVYSPDGKQVATSSRDGTARLWDLQGRQVAELKGHEEVVYSVVYSPNGQQMATHSRDGTARLWDLQGKQLAELKGHQGTVSSVVYSPDSKQVATHGEDGTARLWDLQGNQLAELKGHQGAVSSVVYSPDSKQVATHGEDGTARLWDLQSKQLAELKGHQDFVESVFYSPDGNQVATGGWGNTARLWNLQGKQLAELKGHQDDVLSGVYSVLSVVYSPNAQQVATSSMDGTARLWDLQGKQLALLKGHQGTIFSVVYSPDGKQVATRGSDGTARLWDLQGRQVAALKGHQGDVSSVVYSPDGKQVATSGSDGTARLWDLQGRQVAALKGHQGDVSSVVYSPDSKQVATSGEDGTARLWDLRGKQRLELKGHQGDVSSVVYSPDGKQVATSGSDGTARLWDLQGKQVAELKGHQGSVSSVVYSPDSKQVATSGSDYTARLWDLQGQQLAIFEGRDAVFSPDGTMLATITGDTVKLWRVETFDQLVGRACDWVRPYLTNNPDVSAEDRQLCDGV